MFDKREETDGLIEAARGVLARYGPGDVVPHGELQEATGCAPGETRYYKLVHRARQQHCDATGVWSQYVAGVGFRLLTPQEQLTEEQHYRRKRARRQIRIGGNVAEATRDEHLTEHQRRLKQLVIEDGKRSQRDILADERHEKWLLKPPSDRPITVRPPRIADHTGPDKLIG